MKRTVSIARKYSILIVLLSFSAAICIGQDGTIVNPAQYLFPDFTLSKLAMNGGRDLTLLMNYNIVTEKMVFMQKADVYDLTEYSKVDTIYIQKHKFIPHGKLFYEVATEGNVTLLIQHKGSIQAPPKPAAYGGTSEVASADYVNYMKLGNEVYRLKNIPNLIIKAQPEFLLLKDKTPVKFMNEKQLTALIPLYKEDIRSYVKKNKIRFDRLPDMVRLISFCNSISK